MNKKISQLDTYSSDVSSAYIPIVVGGTTYKLPIKGKLAQVSELKPFFDNSLSLEDSLAVLQSKGEKYSSLVSLATTVKTFLESADISDATINRWKELENFLSGVTDTETLSGLLEEMKTTLQTDINENSSAISVEKQRATGVEKTLSEDITTINNTAVKSMVSTNEEFNNIVKELYFDRWVDISKISTISLKRNGIAGKNIVWEMYIVDTNGKSSWASFGKNAETDDVNVATIGAQEEHFLYGQGVTVYAVIDWSQVTNNNGEGVKDDAFSVKGKMLTSINTAKYFPKISECLANHKYTHSPIANSIIKELYFENLTKNGTPISDYEFKKFFSLQRIDRNKLSDDGSGKRVWSLVFYVKNPDVDTSIQGVDPDNHFFSSITVSPEKDVVVKMPMSTTLKYPNSEGELTTYNFAATTYAVIDWTKLKNGEANTIIAPLLGGCLDVRNSPIISAYIGNTIKWSSSFNMNDYKAQGVYYITGERLQSENDNLPIMNASSGHTISGQLTVLDASLSKTEQCITQYLKLTNRLGNETKHYSRSQKYVINNAANPPEVTEDLWSPWQELQGTTYLGQVTKSQLDKVIDNGIYTGVVMDNELLPQGSTFTMLVMNNYAVNSAVGMPAQARQVSQTFFALPLSDVSTGAIVPQSALQLTRVGYGQNTIMWNRPERGVYCITSRMMSSQHKYVDISKYKEIRDLGWQSSIIIDQSNLKIGESVWFEVMFDYTILARIKYSETGNIDMVDSDLTPFSTRASVYWEKTGQNTAIVETFCYNPKSAKMHNKKFEITI